MPTPNTQQVAEFIARFKAANPLDDLRIAQNPDSVFVDTDLLTDTHPSTLR